MAGKAFILITVQGNHLSMNIQEKEQQNIKKVALSKAKTKNALEPEEALDILLDVFRILRESGLVVGVKDAPETEKRKAGIFIYVSGVSYKEGHFSAQ